MYSANFDKYGGTVEKLNFVNLNICVMLVTHETLLHLFEYILRLEDTTALDSEALIRLRKWQWQTGCLHTTPSWSPKYKPATFWVECRLIQNACTKIIRCLTPTIYSFLTPFKQRLYLFCQFWLLKLKKGFSTIKRYYSTAHFPTWLTFFEQLYIRIKS